MGGGAEYPPRTPDRLAFPLVGQPVAVTEKPSATPGVVRFELNRSLTGMGHERYASVSEATGNTPGAVLARRLFETGQVGAVHVYANVVTVDLAKGYGSDGLSDIVREIGRAHV